MSASLKLRQLESKLSVLKAQQQHFLKEREKEIAVLLTSLELTALEDTVLLGGLLFLKGESPRAYARGIFCLKSLARSSFRSLSLLHPQVNAWSFTRCLRISAE